MCIKCGEDGCARCVLDVKMGVVDVVKMGVVGMH